MNPQMLPDDVLKLMVRHERELREQSAVALEKALALQAREYDRRLAELNHAHARALEDKAMFLQKALYEQTQRDFQTWREEIIATLAADRERHATNHRIMLALLAIFGLVIAVIEFLSR